MTTEANQAALFIDVDNLFISAQNAGLPFSLSLVIDRVRQEGTLMSARAYADWSNPYLRPVLSDFRQQAIEQVHLPTTTPGGAGDVKNTADIQLALDALEMVFSRVSPDTIVIASGDRDFVPLVQKLKRYGTHVLGMAVENAVSPVLAQACNSFVYYDTLLPPEPEAEPEAPEHDMSAVNALLLRAIRAVSGEDRPADSQNVLAMMRQLDATFDLGRYRMTFQELLDEAQGAGYISVRKDSQEISPGEEQPRTAAQPPSRDYDYSSEGYALASYRTILQEHRIPLLPWRVRNELITLLWDLRDQYGAMSFDEMRYEMERFSASNGLDIHYAAIRKLLYSLNFAFRFSLDGKTPHNVRVPDEVQTQVVILGTAQEAARAVNLQYLDTLRRAGAHLMSVPVAQSLFEQDAHQPEQLQEAEELCLELQPPTAIGMAFQAARNSGGSRASATAG